MALQKKLKKLSFTELARMTSTHRSVCWPLLSECFFCGGKRNPIRDCELRWAKTINSVMNIIGRHESNRTNDETVKTWE